ncbi:MAG: glycosyltransferase family A protein [Proteiniphilum sp.]
MGNPMVSIIVPAYNAEKFIEETVRSALATRYVPIEIVIVDDGSSDATPNILEKIAEEHDIVRVYTQANAGASVARNHAIREAKGVYILPLDSDNLISPDYVQEAVKVLQARPEVKLVSCEAWFFGEKNGRWKSPKFSINQLCLHNLIDNCAMYRKEDWQKVGGYCHKILGREDWDFWLSLFENGGEFVRLPIVGLYYRVRSDSKRIKTRHLHKVIIDALNYRHKQLFFRELNGKLHYQRTHSKGFNRLIGLFRPHHVHVNVQDPVVEKLVYVANEPEEARDFIRMPQGEIRYIRYEERRFHLPGTQIKKSKARHAFEPANKLHLGYYEQQKSLFILVSYLIVKTER